MESNNTALVLFTIVVGLIGGTVGFYFWYKQQQNQQQQQQQYRQPSSSSKPTSKIHKFLSQQQEEDIDLDKVRALRVKKFQYFKLPPLPWGKLQQSIHIKNVQADINPEILQKRAQFSALNSLQELFAWKPSESQWTQLGKSNFKFDQKDRENRINQPQILVCHDYNGKKLDDQQLQGSSSGDAYRISRWENIDIFVYFSHKLVTLPPPGWVTAAHRNGVKVLGTFITEWEAGAEICRRFLVSKQLVHLVVNKLVQLAEFYGFEGWLINIENKIELDHIDNLVYFLNKLQSGVRENIPGGMVVWYDSVTKDGTLDWQNTVNEKNSIFMDAADAIFINYQWQPNDLEKLSQFCQGQGGEENSLGGGDKGKKENGNGDRDKSKVYMGIDVFARNTFYSAGKDCCQGVESALENGFSVAMFAPGWTHEKNQSSDVDWTEIDDEFWTEVNACVKRNRGAEYFTRCQVHSLPFYTDFNVGAGKQYFIQGIRATDQEWFNLSLQQLQPVSYLQVSDEIVYNGSRSIILEQSDQTIPLFNFDITLQDGIQVGFTSHAGQIELHLKLSDSFTGQSRDMILAGTRTRTHVEDVMWSNLSFKGKDLVALPVATKTELANDIEWVTYRFHIPSFRVKGWNLRGISYCQLLDPAPGEKEKEEQIAFLGRIWCSNIEEKRANFEVKNLNISEVVFNVDQDSLEGVLYGMLSWDVVGDGNISRFEVWCGIDDEEVDINKYKIVTKIEGKVPKGMKWLGCSSIGLFQVNDLGIRASACRVLFVVQGIDEMGIRQRVEDVAHVELLLR